MTDEEFAIKLGTRIRELRKLKGISQLELAYDMDMSMNTISTIELGKISPKVETIKKIAQKLNVDIAEIFQFSESSSKDKNTRKKIEELSRLLMNEDKAFIDLVLETVNILKKAQNLK